MRLSLIIITFLTCLSGYAQNSFFAQHTYAMPESVPAKIGIDSYASATLLYKNQKLVGADHLVSSLLFAKYPIVNHKNNRLTLGLVLAKNNIKGAGSLTEQLFSSTIAYSFNYKNNAGVSFAMDLGMVSKKIDLKDVQTGAMWTIENGFDPNLSSGENLSTDRLVYPKLNASLYWFANDRYKNTKSYFGISVFQVNKYKDSFYDSKELTSSIQFTWLGGVRVYSKNQIALIPKFLITSTTTSTYLKLGMDFNYSLSGYSSRVFRKENSFNIEINYQFDKGAQFGLQYLQPWYAVGLAYHVDMSNKAKSGIFNNAVEVLFVLRNPIETTRKKNKSRRNKRSRSKKKKTKRTQTIKEDTVIGDSVITPADSVVDAEKEIQLFSDSMVVEVTPFKIPIIEETNKKETENWETTVRFGSENSFHFDFNSAEINNDSYQKLEELTKLLKNFPESKVILVGHTDDIGSAKRNLAFSIIRATAAAEVLIKKGVSKSQIKVRGMGELEPIDTNETDQGRSNNRRIEFYIINE